MKVTPEQFSAARAILRLKQADIASAAGMTKPQYSKFESGNAGIQKATYERLISFFTSEGIEFLGSDGVRKSTVGVVTLEGRDGFAQFRKDVLTTAKNFEDPDICISNVDERQFDKWGAGVVNRDYRSEMAIIRESKPDFRFRTLVKKGDFHLSAARHSSYRWVDDEKFSDIPFYIYGDKTAMLLFEPDDIHIVIIKHPKLTDFYRTQFNMMWEKAQALDFDPKDYIPVGSLGGQNANS